MTEQEKQLVNVMRESKYSGNTLHLEEYAKEIIKAFPQILKKPVPLQHSDMTGETFISYEEDLFIKEEWDKFKDTYYCEVIP